MHALFIWSTESRNIEGILASVSLWPLLELVAHVVPERLIITLYNVCAVPWGDIMINVGDIMSSVGGYHDACGGIS